MDRMREDMKNGCILPTIKFMEIKNFDQNESIDAELINKFLAKFGNIPLSDSQPMFRLIWTDNENELRRGTYNIFHAGIFLKTETGVLRVPKYPHLKERYIIEKWYPPEIYFTPELPESVNGGYEVKYIFEDEKYNRLPLRMKVAEKLMKSWMKPNPSKMARESRDRLAAQVKEEKSYQADMDTIDTSDIQSNLHFGEAIIVPKEYEGLSPNLRKE